jgi:hypothetical protein
MNNIMLDITTFPHSDNSSLTSLHRPYKLSLEEFNSLVVTDQELKARELIYILESQMHSWPDSFINCDEVLRPRHSFTKGIYKRELDIPAKMLVVGKRHAQEHIVLITKGSAICFTERGREVVSAGYSFISPAGEKRVVVALEDCTWVTIHRTDSMDLLKIEEQLVIKEPLREAKNVQLFRIMERNRVKELT